ncbi:chorismate mutase [Chitinophaga niastensis]|uniref:chorismate mutase n=1 Tax=Chitinophaga niastensis TaxID=536980 RepID=A0A2P8HGN6_CHINA|nr:chorismate mutase [Chitinophaga niastensis]PSL45382.1 chorismate mutase [Chitinophaga niastensis]
MNPIWLKPFQLTFGICLLIGSTSLAQSLPDKTTDTSKNALQVYRQKIDSLDKQLIAILGERERVVKEVGVYKVAHHMPALQQDRFKQMMEPRIIAGKKEGLSEEFITEFMNAIHEESLRIERNIIH